MRRTRSNLLALALLVFIISGMPINVPLKTFTLSYATRYMYAGILCLLNTAHSSLGVNFQLRFLPFLKFSEGRRFRNILVYGFIGIVQDSSSNF